LSECRELEWARVNLVVAVLIWVMIYPMMLKIDPSCLKDVGPAAARARADAGRELADQAVHDGGAGRCCSSACVRGPGAAEDAQQYIAGMILLGVAPCTAMVFVWSQLTRGDANYTLVQVSVNDLVMVVAFAPIAGLLLGVTDDRGALGDADRVGAAVRGRAAARRDRDPPRLLSRERRGGMGRSAEADGRSHRAAADRRAALRFQAETIVAQPCGWR
jgi:hypothetical protein